MYKRQIEHAWGLSRAVHRAVSLESLVEQSDFITIHVPLTPNTRNYVSRDLLKHCKPTAMLLNFARGELVDTPAVLEALEEGRLAKYIVDFPTEEVIGRKNVIAIPHLGASTPEAEENCAVMAARELKDYLENGNILHSVNFPECVLPRSGSMRICIIHQNVPNMVGRITALLAERNANITNMMNKSRGNIAYTMLDIDEHLNGTLHHDLASIESVLRVTLYK